MPSLETWAKGVLITAVSLVVINVAVSIRARDLSRARLRACNLADTKAILPQTREPREFRQPEVYGPEVPAGINQ